jgi:hypothetical protein
MPVVAWQNGFSAVARLTADDWAAFLAGLATTSGVDSLPTKFAVRFVGPDDKAERDNP